MRPRFRTRPARSELLELELHEMIRDYPETLSVLRSHGVDLREQGTRSLAELSDPDDPDAAVPEPVVDDLLDAVSWRPENG